jgi:O-antigen ligase
LLQLDIKCMTQTSNSGLLPNALGSRLHWLFLIAFFIYNNQVNGPWASTEGAGRVGGVTVSNALGFALTSGFAAGIVVLSVCKLKKLLYVTRESWPLLALLGIAVASSAWSSNPMLTLRRSILLVASSFAGMYIGVTLSESQQVKLLRVVAVILVLASVVTAVVAPTVGFHDAGPVGGALRGVFFHKNTFGRFLALCVCLVMIGRRFKLSFPLRTCAIVLIAVLLAMCRSATALVVSCVMVVATYLIRYLTRIRGSKAQLGALVLVVALVVVCAVGVVNANMFLSAFDRDSEMTGRIPLWLAVDAQIMQRPLLGYGLSGFFEYGLHRAAIGTTNGWHAMHAHNGFLQLTIELGFVGLALFLVMAASCTVKALRHARKHRDDPYATWPIAYVTFLALYNLTEASLVRSTNVFWILFVAVWASVVYTAHRERLELAPAAADESNDHEPLVHPAASVAEAHARVY